MITVLVTFCAAGGSHHKHIIIHVPYHVKHHHHTHTIFKHIKHIDHGHHDHHDHHDHHGHDDDYKISFPGNHFDFGGLNYFPVSISISFFQFLLDFKPKNNI